MENTIENANNFLNGIEFNRLEIAKLLVAYASTLTPPVPDQNVVRVPKYADHHEWESDLSNAEANGFNDCINQIKRLNPTLTFTESK